MQQSTAIKQRQQRPIPRIVHDTVIDYIDDATEFDPFPAGAAIKRVEHLRARHAPVATARPLPRPRAVARPPMRPPMRPQLVLVPPAPPRPAPPFVPPPGRHYSYVEECEQRYLETQRVAPLPGSAIFGRSIVSRLAAPLAVVVALVLVVAVGCFVVRDDQREAQHVAAPIESTSPRPAAVHRPLVAVVAEAPAPIVVESVASVVSPMKRVTSRPVHLETRRVTKPGGVKPAKKTARRRPITVDASTPLGILRPS